MFQWLDGHEVLVGWLTGASVLMFVGSLIAVPWLVVHIPSDYFLHRRREVNPWSANHPVLRFLLRVLKNLCGVVLIVAGLALLFLPGQGLLTLLVGLICLDFPGKYAFERYLVSRRPVIRSINWIRAKSKHPPLKLPPH